MSLFKLNEMEEIIPSIPPEIVAEYLLTSIFLGIILTILAVWTSRKISECFVKIQEIQLNKGMNNGISSPPPGIIIQQVLSYPELIVGSANVLFLCFGMTGIMILVNNNLARAFAIGAAIAVVRFRIKFDSQGLAASLFFGVLVGMACGVGQLMTAALITIAFCLLQIVIVSLMNYSQK